jgi:hypothetical protein
MIADPVQTPLSLVREYVRDGAGILGVSDLLERALLFVVAVKVSQVHAIVVARWRRCSLEAEHFCTRSQQRCPWKTILLSAP